MGKGTASPACSSPLPILGSGVGAEGGNCPRRSRPFTQQGSCGARLLFAEVSVQPRGSSTLLGAAPPPAGRLCRTGACCATLYRGR